MSRPIMQFEEIWAISKPDDFVYELSKFIEHKGHVRKLPLSQLEYAVDLLMSIQAWIDMEGFCELFYQQYTIADCALVESVMREIGADRLADLFGEAKEIYVRHQTDITDEEFKELTPFDFPEPDGTRFDEIADLFSASDSQLYDLPTRLAGFVRKYRNEFSP